MRAVSLGSIAAVVTLLASGCAREQTTPAAVAPPKPPFKIVATPKQVMQAITIPAADVMWKVAGEAPKDDAGWLAVENAALAMAESANLLMMEGRAKDQGEWMKESRALIDISVAAATAAREKNVEKFTDIGDKLYTVCESCHMKYMPQPAQ